MLQFMGKHSSANFWSKNSFQENLFCSKQLESYSKRSVNCVISAISSQLQIWQQACYVIS